MGKSEQALQRRLPLVSISVLQAVISKTRLRIATCRMPLGGGSELGSGSRGDAQSWPSPAWRCGIDAGIAGLARLLCFGDVIAAEESSLSPSSVSWLRWTARCPAEQLRGGL